MIAFFDTNVYIRILRGTFPKEALEELISRFIIRLSPVVASELLRGTTRKTQKEVQKLVDTLIPIEPPSWRRAWIETRKLLLKVFPYHEEIGLYRLQNDVLLALTARYTGARLITSDSHFETIARYIRFFYIHVG